MPRRADAPVNSLERTAVGADATPLGRRRLARGRRRLDGGADDARRVRRGREHSRRRPGRSQAAARGDAEAAATRGARGPPRGRAATASAEIKFIGATLFDGAPESLVAHRRRRTTSPGFTRRGARVDAEGKWSLTPERLANEIADKVPAGSSVFDCCCGCGGNAIAFARRCAVTAIDVSSDRVALARRNAKIYGVDVRVDVGDALRDERTADVLFVDAPWGREWDKERTDLDSLPLLRDVLAAAPGRFKRVLAKVPPSFATAAVPGAAAEAFFGHESGDARRVKFVLLDLVL